MIKQIGNLFKTADNILSHDKELILQAEVVLLHYMCSKVSRAERYRIFPTAAANIFFSLTLTPIIIILCLPFRLKGLACIGVSILSYIFSSELIYNLGFEDTTKIELSLYTLTSCYILLFPLSFSNYINIFIFNLCDLLLLGQVSIWLSNLVVSTEKSTKVVMKIKMINSILMNFFISRSAIERPKKNETEVLNEELHDKLFELISAEKTDESAEEIIKSIDEYWDINLV